MQGEEALERAKEEYEARRVADGWDEAPPLADFAVPLEVSAQRGQGP